MSLELSNYVVLTGILIVVGLFLKKWEPPMAAYLANQILKGKLDYELVVSRYGTYKEDIDTILIAEGKQDLIK